jgi:hypothetical protein
LNLERQSVYDSKYHYEQQAKKLLHIYAKIVGDQTISAKLEALHSSGSNQTLGTRGGPHCPYRRGAEAADSSKATRGAEKINLGALCTVLRQFHFHVVARFADDPSWPGLPPQRVIPSLSSSGCQILGSLMIRHTIDAAVRKSKITADC